MKYPGKEAYHFPAGTSHTSPCMDPYFSSPKYQAKKEKWKREADTLKKATLIDRDHDEKPDEPGETE